MLFRSGLPWTGPNDWNVARRFGQAIAPSYGTLFVFHVVFGRFIALATVSAPRGVGLSMKAFLKSRVAAETITKGVELEHA